MKRYLPDLLDLGGFPEPLTSGSENSWRRWNKERLEKIIYEDIRDLENVKTLESIYLLADELPNKVGSPLSIRSLSEDLQRAHQYSRILPSAPWKKRLWTR